MNCTNLIFLIFLYNINIQPETSHTGIRPEAGSTLSKGTGMNMKTTVTDTEGAENNVNVS